MKVAELPDAARSSVSLTPRAFDRRLYTGMAVLAAAVVFVGFSRTFYLRAWFNTAPLSALRYAHGAVMTTWYVLFLAQAILISRHRVDIHRRLGIAAACSAAAMASSAMIPEELSDMPGP